jgi:hypothetical protein
MASSPSRTLKLTYLGDASQLGKSTKKAGDDVQSLGERAKGVGKVLGAAFLAAGAAGVAMGKKLFDAFEQVSTANARIEAVVTSMGNFEGQIAGVTDRLVKQAEATAKLTGVDRNLIKESQALLLTFDSVNKTAGEAGGVFDRATQAAVDLAAAGFGSVTGNAQQLGRALEDPIRGLTALTRSGVTFTAEQQELIKSLVESNQLLAAQDIVLQAIERQVGGVAEATANGSARIRQSFGILTEQIAMALAPAFERLVEFGLQFVDDVAAWWDRNGANIIQSFREFAERVKETWTEFQTFVRLVKDELGSRGVFERLREQGNAISLAFAGVRDAWTNLLNTISGPQTEQRASTFARIIELQYVKPIEKLLETVETALKALELFFKAAEFFERVRQGFTSDEGRDRLGMLAPGGSGLTPGGLARGSTLPPAVTVNVSGAIDPEGTARVIQRTLTGSALRVGQVPVAGLAVAQ